MNAIRNYSNRRRHYIMSPIVPINLVILLLQTSVFVSTADGSACRTKNGSVIAETDLASIPGRVFKWAPEENGHCYAMGICETIPNVTQAMDAIIRYENKCDSGQATVYGRLNETSFVKKRNFSVLTYHGGDMCGGNDSTIRRSAQILFMEGQTKDNQYSVTVIDQTNEDCTTPLLIVYVVAKGDGATTTTPVPTKSCGGLSGGSIFSLIFLIIALAYFIGGLCYRRFHLHATGVDQIPNYSFWRRAGALAADGCDFCCRCKDIDQQSSRTAGFPSYGGAGVSNLHQQGMSPFSTQSPRISSDENILEP
ncbi:hypothetical protein ACOME3_003271 [Neoechinorhynchus agilis]